MRWTVNDRSVPVTTPFGTVALRIDGDPEGSPLLLCQRFRGTMEDWRIGTLNSSRCWRGGGS
jgi:hypothetical protein